MLTSTDCFVCRGFFNKTDKKEVKTINITGVTTIYDSNADKRFYYYGRMPSLISDNIPVGLYLIRLEMRNSNNEVVSKFPLIPLEVTKASLAE